jgi:hypothetical protein
MKSNIFNSLSFFTGIKKDEPDKNSNKEFEKIREFKMKNLPFQLKPTYTSIIPLRIYTCWHAKELPPLMKKKYG